MIHVGHFQQQVVLSLCNWANDGTLNSLSEQQLADGSCAEGNEGCDGGLMDDASGYIIKEGWSCTGEDGICKASSCETKYNEIKAYTDVTCEDSIALEYAVAEVCVSVASQFYSGGVLTGSCATITWCISCWIWHWWWSRILES